LEENSRRNLEILDGSISSIEEKSRMVIEAIRYEKEIMNEKNVQNTIDYFMQLGYRNNVYNPEMPHILPEDNIILVYE
jgi:hypothetical protein